MYKVLLVDDERIIMEGLKQIIDSFNLALDVFQIAEDGEEALSIIGSFIPDVIFTDIRMENMDVLQLIEEIRKKGDWGREVPIVIISGYGEFEYAKKAIGHKVYDYILKPINKQVLYELLVKIKRDLDNKVKGIGDQKDFYDASVGVFMKILKDDSMNEAHINSLLRSIHIDTDGYTGFFLVRILKDDGVLLPEVVKSLLFYLPGELLFKFCLGRGMICFSGVRANTVNSKTPDLNVLGAISKKERVMFFFSDFFISLSGLPSAYNQLELVTKQRKVTNSQLVFTYTDFKNFGGKGPAFTNEINEIIKGIEHSELTPVINNLNKIHDYIASLNNLSITYIEKLYRNICVNLQRSFSFLNGLEQFSLILERLEDVGDVINDSESFEDIHKNIKKIILEFFNYYYSSNVKLIGANFIVQKAKEYIDTNYSDRTMSLDSIASKLQISRAYLSTQFKKNLDMSFCDYVKKVRVENAVRILKSTDINVSEIGMMVGYTGEKAFFNIFRQEIGIPPGKYRRKMKFEV